ncbi:ATP-binding protein [Janibacter sp. LM]|uniref:ATP-binding protein n=1 Tax=Janibacter sp. LM TaxID=3144845 RepID=UPI0031F719F6
MKIGRANQKRAKGELDTSLPKSYDWQLKGISGHVTTARGEVRAWYVLREVDWEFLSTDQREAHIHNAGRLLAGLAGRSVHERVSSMPFAASMWAAALDAGTPSPVDEDAWRQYLTGGQRVLASRSLSATPVLWGVSVGNESTVSRFLAGFGKGDRAGRASDRLSGDIENLDALMESIGRPATQREVEWLVSRSRGLGLPNPSPSWVAGAEPVDVFDLAGVMDQVEVHPGAVGSRTVRLVGSPDRSKTVDPVETHVAVLSMARMEDRSIPETSPPWAAYARRFGGFEMSSHFVVRDGRGAAKDVEKRLQLIHDQKDQFQRVDSRMEPPMLGQAHKAARAMKHEMEEGYGTEATRVYAYVRFAVAAPTSKQALERAQGLIKHYEAERIDLKFMRNVEGAYREFVPGEGISTTAHLRHMPVITYAAGLPNISSRLGDREGHLIGSTVGAGGHPFIWDMHQGMERFSRSGLTPLVSGLGGGKSTLMGLLAALETLSNVSTTVFDPSGPLARITKWEPIASVSSSLNLLDAAEGTLSPFGVVVDPSLESVEADDAVQEKLRAIATRRERGEYLEQKWRDAQQVARMERTALALDAMRSILPEGVMSGAMTEVLLSRALAQQTSRQDASLADVVELLADRSLFPEDMARTLYESLHQMMDHPRTRLFFNPGAQEQSSSRLLVITLPGMSLPKQEAERSSWSVDERLSVAVLNLAAQFASSRIYSGGMNERKFVGLDEAHRLSEWASGRNLFARLERDSRKWNARIVTSSQDRHTALSAQSASKALISDAFIGALDDPDQQEDALRLIGVKTGVGYEQTLGNLRSPEGTPESAEYRDFVARINGKVGRFRVNRDLLPGLWELLDTRPKGQERRALGGTTSELEWV